MKDAKHIVYRYDGNPHTEEFVKDLEGKEMFPLKNSIINRNGKEWKVVAVHEISAMRGQLQIFRVFLARVGEEESR